MKELDSDFIIRGKALKELGWFFWLPMARNQERFLTRGISCFEVHLKEYKALNQKWLRCSKNNYAIGFTPGESFENGFWESKNVLGSS